jgi:hypothetical protein
LWQLLLPLVRKQTRQQQHNHHHHQLPIKGLEMQGWTQQAVQLLLMQLQLSS